MSIPERHETAAEDRIPWSQLIAYGMGGLIPVAIFNIAGQLMGLLGNISLGLSAFWLGTIMIIPRLWDALADPIVGHLSDNARTRWGRRRPFILIGGIAIAVSFVAMWWVPAAKASRRCSHPTAAYNWFQLAYILVGLLIFFTSTTIFEIPHGALGMEMSGDYHERTRLFSAKSFLGNLFAMGTPWLIFLAGLEFLPRPRRRPNRWHALRLHVHRRRAHPDGRLVVLRAQRTRFRSRQGAAQIVLLERHARHREQSHVHESGRDHLHARDGL